MNYLYQKDVTTPEVPDRTPTKEQIAAAKKFIDGLVKNEPKEYNDLLAPVEGKYPHVFTDSEKVAIFDEMNREKDPPVITPVEDPIVEDPAGEEEINP